MQVLINTAHLRAAACCASDKDARYYLNGVLVEARAEETRIAATNGECAAVLRDVLLVGSQDVLPDVIVPNATVKMACSLKSAVLTLEYKDGKWSLGGISFNPVDGKFPDYRRIIPCRHSGEAAQFSLELLSRFGKIAKALGHRGNPIIRHNGTGAAQVQLYGRDEFVGVIMPLNAFTAKNPDTGLIAWGAER